MSSSKLLMALTILVAFAELSGTGEAFSSRRLLLFRIPEGLTKLLPPIRPATKHHRNRPHVRSPPKSEEVPEFDPFDPTPTAPELYFPPPGPTPPEVPTAPALPPATSPPETPIVPYFPYYFNPMPQPPAREPAPPEVPTVPALPPATSPPETPIVPYFPYYFNPMPQPPAREPAPAPTGSPWSD